MPIPGGVIRTDHRAMQAETHCSGPWDYDREATWPQEIIEKAWELGLMSSQLPEQYGGAGASYVDGALISEELAWGCAAIATSIGANELAAVPVLLGGSESVKAKYLGMLAEEPRLASAA